MDDLLDLNWSSPPTGTSSKPLAPSLQPSKPKPTGAAATSSFDFLAKSNTGSSSRTGTPNYYQSSTPRTTTPLAPPIQAAPQPKAQPTTNGTGGDAFSSLLGMGSSSDSSKNLTMAQKQAQILEERRLKEEREDWGIGNNSDQLPIRARRLLGCPHLYNRYPRNHPMRSMAYYSPLYLAHPLPHLVEAPLLHRSRIAEKGHSGITPTF
jgi:hypothetical protein